MKVETGLIPKRLPELVVVEGLARVKEELIRAFLVCATLLHKIGMSQALDESV